jgi:nucleoporin NDC1
LLLFALFSVLKFAYIMYAALSHLVCASLVEDQFGVVQRDIPQILEALSSFLHAVDQYHVEVNTKHTPPSLSGSDTPSPQELLDRESARIELEKAQEILLDVRDGVFSADYG